MREWDANCVSVFFVLVRRHLRVNVFHRLIAYRALSARVSPAGTHISLSALRPGERCNNTKQRQQQSQHEKRSKERKKKDDIVFYIINS